MLWRRSLEGIIFGENGSSCQRAYLSPLYVISSIYGLGVRARLFLYGTGLLKGSRLPCKVISVGNITLGGTGKTPTVEHIAKLLKEEGMDVVVLSRGYGGRMERSFGVVSDGKQILLSPGEDGSKAFLFSSAVAAISRADTPLPSFTPTWSSWMMDFNTCGSNEMWISSWWIPTPGLGMVTCSPGVR